jgi:hypothetical protein
MNQNQRLGYVWLSIVYDTNHGANIRFDFRSTVQYKFIFKLLSKAKNSKTFTKKQSHNDNITKLCKYQQNCMYFTRQFCCYRGLARLIFKQKGYHNIHSFTQSGFCEVRNLSRNDPLQWNTPNLKIMQTIPMGQEEYKR